MGQVKAGAISFVVLTLLWFGAITVSAQDTICPALVTVALDTTHTNCDGTGRDQVCYGHDLLHAQAQPGVTAFALNHSGDREDLFKLKSLRLSVLDEDTNTWGIALMRLRAGLSASSPEQNVTFLLFGNVEVENAVPPPSELDVTVSVDSYVNVRRAPFATAGVLGTLAPGERVRAVGRLDDSSWLRVELPGSGTAGWLYAPLAASDDGDIVTLNVEAAWTPHFGPMQAFYLENGTTASPACRTASTDGLLIQTPEGVAEVNLLLNEVDIHLSATALVQAHPGEDLTIDVLDGWVDAQVMGVKQTALAGSQMSISLDADGVPNAPPEVQPYDPTGMADLPLDMLDAPIELPPPLTDEEIADIGQNTSATDTTGTDTSGSNTSGSGSGWGKGGNPNKGNLDQGQSGSPPGQSGSPPGQSGSPPGQSGSPPGQGGEHPTGKK